MEPEAEDSTPLANKRPSEMDPALGVPSSKKARQADDQSAEFGAASLLASLPSTSSASFSTDRRSELSEADVGITEYIDASLPPFSAILKHRFTDFLVYEVAPDGEVVRLRDIERPQLPPTPQPEAVSAEAQMDEEGWPVGAEEKLSPILGEEKVTELKAFVNAGPSLLTQRSAHGRGGGRGSARSRGRGRGASHNKHPHNSPPNAEASGEAQNGESSGAVHQSPQKVTSNPIESKEARGFFHKTIREVFAGRLLTEHRETDNGDAVIDITWNAGGKHARRTRSEDPEPPYIYFTLQKTNRETQDALSIISRALNCHVSKDLAICGTKDKRSVSVQRVSLRRGRRTITEVWDRLTALRTGGEGSRGRANFRGRGGRGRGGRGGGASPFDRGEKGIRVGDLEYKPEPLKLGSLGGNRFLITLRDVQPPDEEGLTKPLETLRDHGFLNYYGMQRFGSSVLGTHMVGLALFRSDWALAADLVLRPRPGDAQDAEMARRLWTDGDKSKDLAKKVHGMFSRRWIAERCMLEHYSRQGATDHLGAIAKIPHNLRLMYAHAYQSYLWNTILSERVRLFGCAKPVIGDLVLLDEEETDTVAAVDDVEEVDSVHEDQPEAEPTTLKGSRRAKVLRTPEDLAQYTIFDVVLPLPGYDIIYPENGLADKYEAMMRADGLDWKDLRRSRAEYSMAGTYRKILHLPKDVSWRVIPYTNPDHPLARADEDALLGIDLPTEPLPTSPTADDSTAKAHAHLALQIELTLGQSTYATMALREVLKRETGSGAWKEMTRAMQKRLAEPAEASQTVDEVQQEAKAEAAAVEDAMVH